jgi:hypothetical protein
LLEWLNDRSGSARVIATSARSVFPNVQRGLFSDSLYYRLNTVTLALNRQGRARHVGHAQRFGLFEQDVLGIWTAPSGDQGAWFNDPDGDAPSASRHT